MIRRMLVLGALLVTTMATLAITATTASAQYVPGTPGIIVDPGSVTVGGTITVQGTGCPANVTVTIKIGTVVVGTATSNDAGNFTFHVTLPPSIKPGQYTVHALCGDLDLTAVLSVSALPPTTTISTGWHPAEDRYRFRHLGQDRPQLRRRRWAARAGHPPPSPPHLAGPSRLAPRPPATRSSASLPTPATTTSKRAYTAAAIEWHPDHWRDASPDERERAERHIREVNAAWEVLGSPAARAAYDAELAEAARPRPSSPDRPARPAPGRRRSAIAWSIPEPSRGRPRPRSGAVGGGRR